MKRFKDILKEGHDSYPADDMTIKELRIALNSAEHILDMIEEGAMVQRWQISAIVKASEELASVCTSMRADHDENDEGEDEAHEYHYQMNFEEAQLDEAKIDKDHPIAKEYYSLKKRDLKDLRNMIAQRHRIVDTSEFRSKEHAASHLIRLMHGNKKVDQVFGFNEEAHLDEMFYTKKVYQAKGEPAKWAIIPKGQVKPVKVLDTEEEANYRARMMSVKKKSYNEK